LKGAQLEISDAEWDTMKERMDSLEKQVTQLQENIDGLIRVNVVWTEATKGLIEGFNLLRNSVVLKPSEPKQ
jgi:hypothetical protein